MAEASSSKTSAQDSGVPGNMTYDAVADGHIVRASSNPPAVSPAEHLANLLVLQFTMWQNTKDRKWLKGIIKSMSDVARDLKNGPYTGSEGVKAFFDFERADLSEDEALDVVREVLATKPYVTDLSVTTIQVVHRVLAENEDWAGRLPYEDLSPFLQLCQMEIPSNACNEVIKAKIDKALDVVEIMSRNKDDRAMSVIAELEKDTIDTNAFFLAAVQTELQSICDDSQESSKAIAAQHGVVQKHSGIEDLMNKIRNVADVATVQDLIEQMGLLQVFQFTASQAQTSERLRKLSDMIAAFLSALEVE